MRLQRRAYSWVLPGGEGREPGEAIGVRDAGPRAAAGSVVLRALEDPVAKRAHVRVPKRGGEVGLLRAAGLARRAVHAGRGAPAGDGGVRVLVALHLVPEEA